MNDKIIFLDIDGVLNRVSDNTSYLAEHPETYGLSDELVKAIADICKKTGAKIVISSNWRKHRDDEPWWYKDKCYQNPLPKLCKLLEEHIIGRIPFIPGFNKAMCLEQWLCQNYPFNKEPKFFILDDENQGYPDNKQLAEHFIKTDPTVGVTVQQLMHILAAFS